MIVHALVAHLQHLTLSIWQCWSPRYNVSVLSTCGGYHPLRLIIASLHKSKQITIMKYHWHETNRNNKMIIPYMIEFVDSDEIVVF